ncbi:MAG: hypothetical protein Q9174_000697 [Haloplaca sp. 1 TL-2023]
MFAVPGWNVLASSLKAQSDSIKDEATTRDDSNGQPSQTERKSKKRKRGHGNTNAIEVTQNNVVEMWQKHIEGKGSISAVKASALPVESQKKRRRKSLGDESHVQKEEHEAAQVPENRNVVNVNSQGDEPSAQQTTNPTSPAPLPQDGKAKYQRRKAKAEEKAALRKAGLLPPARESNVATPSSPPLPTSTIPTKPEASMQVNPPPPPPPNPATTKLTPLQTAMRAKLISARFRHLNQTLYTTPSTHASTLFSSDPEAYASYHAGFRAQVASWPQNPVEIFIKEIKDRGTIGGSKHQKLKPQKRKGAKMGKPQDTSDSSPISEKLDPLPRTRDTCTILDLGCGDAHLHASLLPSISSLRLQVKSFDLSPSDTPNAHLITVSDIAHVPLPDGSADVAIFCLALMGTNWIDFVAEAARVVRVGGECWVGEVRSRFAGATELEKSKSAKGPGKSRDGKKKKRDDEDAGEMGSRQLRVDENEISVQAKNDSMPTKDQQTDIGPFLGVFRRRGFALKGNVDMGNKMFVLMKFVRIRDHTHSKETQAKGQVDGSKFIDKDEHLAIDPETEARILKPCVYKTR